MRTNILRTVTLAVGLLVSTVLWAQQQGGKPKVMTSAAPEETAVYNPSGKAPKATAQKASDKQKPAARDNSNKKATAKAEKPRREKRVKADTPAGARYHALKTNLAFDAIGALNLAYEVQVHNRMTLDIPVTWSLWDAQREHALRIVALQPELRWWMGDEPGRGHFFGLHAHAAWYNLKWDDKRYQDTGRPLLGAGLSYGYKLPIGEHWGAEFNAGLGYANMKYDTYYNVENGAQIDTRIRNYFGLTRLGLSLVYRF